MPNPIDSIGSFFKRGGTIKVTDGLHSMKVIELSLRNGDERHQINIGMTPKDDAGYIGQRFVEAAIAMELRCSEAGAPPVDEPSPYLNDPEFLDLKRKVLADIQSLAPDESYHCLTAADKYLVAPRWSGDACRELAKEGLVVLVENPSHAIAHYRAVSVASPLESRCWR